MFDQLKSLLQAGSAPSKPAPAPKPVVAAPVVAPISDTPERAADPYADLKRFNVVGNTPQQAIPAPAEAVVLPVEPLTPEQLDVAMSQALPTTPQVDPLTREVWNRPVDPEEEKREDLEPRSGKRIEYLVAVYERPTDDSHALTDARILNDKIRHRNANPVPTYSPYKKADTNPQSYILKA
jgi:hypothetical protein